MLARTTNTVTLDRCFYRVLFTRREPRIVEMGVCFMGDPLPAWNYSKGQWLIFYPRTNEL